jgi:hypothetical protein
LKIRTHSESHIVELDDGSIWRIYPGDLDATLNWQPDADIEIERLDNDVGSHFLVSRADNSRVRVIAASESWPVGDIKTKLKRG